MPGAQYNYAISSLIGLAESTTQTINPGSGAGDKLVAADEVFQNLMCRLEQNVMGQNP